MVHLTRDVDPTSLFGADLKDIFGPKADRVHVSELSRKELKKRLEQIDKFLPTDHLGDFPTMYQVTNYALETLKTSRALWGIDLDWCKTLIGCGILRHRSQYKPIKLVSKNNQTQRGLNLRHVVEDILFKFDPKSVLTGLARFSKKTKRYYINDGQHRLVACIIMGIRDIPLDVEISELQSTDLRHYAVINLNSLLPSEYDKYRTMVKAVEYAKAENVEIHDPDYVRAWKVKNILDKYRCRMVEQGTTRAPLLCTGVGNMMLNNGQTELASENGLLAFNLLALEPIRTICEKIMSLVRFSYSDNPIDDLKKKIRHTYDLHQLLKEKEISHFFN